MPNLKLILVRTAIFIAALGTVVIVWLVLLPFNPNIHIPAIEHVIRENQIAGIKRLEEALKTQVGPADTWLRVSDLPPEMRAEFRPWNGGLNSRIYVQSFGTMASNAAKAVYLRVESRDVGDRREIRWRRASFAAYTWDDLDGRFFSPTPSGREFPCVYEDGSPCRPPTLRPGSGL